MRSPNYYISQAQLAMSRGERFCVYGVPDVPAEVLARCQRLWMRFGRPAGKYIADWYTFNLEKTRANPSK